MKVLIIDDEPLIRLSLARAFKKYDVKVAEDGREGLTLWRQFAPDLVILDVLMPHLTGPQVLEQIGENPAKVVLISAYAGEYNSETAQSLGAHAYLQKPFGNIFEVLKICEELVNG